jgi:hypothetical protein
MKTLKTPKNVHNRPFHGPWYEMYTKEERRARRRLFKAIRHKLLFSIPMTDEEKVYQSKYGITINSKMDHSGSVSGTHKPKKWKVIDDKVCYYRDITRERMRRNKKK